MTIFPNFLLTKLLCTVLINYLPCALEFGRSFGLSNLSIVEGLSLPLISPLDFSTRRASRARHGVRARRLPVQAARRHEHQRVPDAAPSGRAGLRGGRAHRRHRLQSL